ncbi:hypothetical protein [Bacillus cereus]|uniref:hypothetical protein n=1 Tax=Bacillus cereus TaxID=1396 RepID=UPI00032F53EB|nr:hypothetical protein [Bacillus cereus]EOO44271.1 hypothetical protein ICK_06528 [Bacillus cereus BAG1X2-2]EOP00330.1 hypothetical protein ICO_06286 [Bacillus cereus BAG2O-1]
MAEIQDIQPFLQRIEPFDATKGTSVYFTYTGSQQSMVNNLHIYDKNTGMAVYDHEWSSFERVHHIPDGALQNGKKYVAKIRVKFSDSTYSPYSQEVVFATVKTPILDIDNIDGLGHVYNANVTFIAKYSQANGEAVKNYRFILYDEHEDVIEKFPLRMPIDSPNRLTETVTGLEKSKGYFIECIVETTNGFVHSHRERFIPLYIVPSINGVISTRNDSEEGFVRITSNLKQILGTQVEGTPQVDDDGMDSNNYEYIDNDWIVVPKERPIMFKGLGMNRASDFVMKVWCKDIPNDTMFMEMSQKGTKNDLPIQLWKYKDRVLAIKEYKGVKARYCSNIVTIPKGTAFMLYVKVIEHRIDLELKIL